MNDFRFKTPIGVAPERTVILPPPGAPEESVDPQLAAFADYSKWTMIRSELAPLGPALFKRLQALIADEMPTGEHRERAAAWRRLAARCLKAADKHEKTADLRDDTRRTVRAFAPPYRQHVLEQIKAGYAVELNDAARAALADPHPPESIFTAPRCTGCSAELGPNDFETHPARCPYNNPLPPPFPGPDPENGTWRPLTDGERSTGQVRGRAGLRWLTEQERRDGRTAEPPRHFFTSGPSWGEES